MPPCGKPEFASYAVGSKLAGIPWRSAGLHAERFATVSDACRSAEFGSRSGGGARRALRTSPGRGELPPDRFPDGGLDLHRRAVALLGGLLAIWPAPEARLRTIRSVVLWPPTSLAVGALAATFALPSAGRRRGVLEASAGGGLLSAFAIGCPVCNKLVVMALGFSGALTYFAPLQPILGTAALVLTPAVPRHRVASLSDSCAVPLSSGQATG
jgi:hypothetical protein